MNDEEDDVDFFTRKPRSARSFSRHKSASVSDALDPQTQSGTQTQTGTGAPLLAVPKGSPSRSASRSPSTEEKRKMSASISSESDSDPEIVSSSDEDGRRFPKKIKPTLPRWSREKRSTSAQAVGTKSHLSSATTLEADLTTQDPADDAATRSESAREREVSLTPPPAPSPDKLQAARLLVEHVRAAHLQGTNSSPGQQFRNGTSTSNLTSLDSSDQDFIHWDPEVAKLYRGDDAKQIRERAKREQESRRQMRQMRLAHRIRVSAVSASDPVENISNNDTSFSRTASAPNPVSSSATLLSTPSTLPATQDTGEDSDDSVKLVSGSIASKPSRSANGSNRAGAIALSDSSDDDEAQGDTATRSATPADSASKTEVTNEDQGEVMSLTLLSSLGSMPVSVRPSAQLSKIVAHFVSTFRAESRPAKQRLPDTVDVARIKICFDGVMFDPNPKPKPRTKNAKRGIVSELDVEDGDQIEIVW